MPVNWKQFSDELVAWERTSSHERFMKLCNSFERSIRRAFKQDPLLDFTEVTAALDCIAEEIVRMRRDAEGRKPCERVALELEPSQAERLRQAAAREGLDVADLLGALVDRQLLAAVLGGEAERPKDRRKARRER